MLKEIIAIIRYPPNLFLCLLLAVVAFVGVYSHEHKTVLQQGSFEGSIRVVDTFVSEFKYAQIAMTSSGHRLLLEGDVFLKHGHVYTVVGSIDEANEFEGFQGIDGRLASSAEYKGTGVCDAVCTGLNIQERVRKSISNSYRSVYCNEIFRTFLSNCGEIATLGKALVFGGELSREITQGARRLGISHILVVSGWQIAIIISAVEIALERQRLWLRALLLILVSMFLLLVVGFHPPVVRALFSSWITVMVLWFAGVRVTYTRALALSTVVILIVKPEWVFSVSLHLSILASLGVYLGSKMFIGFKTHVFGTLGASVFVLPYSLYVFGFSPWGLISNIVLLPLIEFATFLQLGIWIPVLGEILALLSLPVLMLVREASLASQDLQLLEIPITKDMVLVVYALYAFFLTKKYIKAKTKQYDTQTTTT